MTYHEKIQAQIDLYLRQIDKLKGKGERLFRRLSPVQAAYPSVFFDMRPLTADGIQLDLKPGSTEELAQVLRRIRRAGFKMVKTEEKPADQQIEYRFTYEDPVLAAEYNDWWPPVHITATFDAENGECRYVKVGEQEETIPATEAKTVVKPIFELQCGEPAEVPA